MNHDFKERRTKKIVLGDYSTVAVQEFVKFLYGKELNHRDLKTDLLIVRELLDMGGLYDVQLLQKAASSFIEEKLTKENVISTMKFAKTNMAKDTVKLCVEFILKSEDLERIINDTEFLHEFPELAVEVLQRKRNKLCNIETKEFLSVGRIAARDLKIFKYDRTKPIYTRIEIGFDHEIEERWERCVSRFVLVDKRPITVRGMELDIINILNVV